MGLISLVAIAVLLLAGRIHASDKLSQSYISKLGHEVQWKHSTTEMKERVEKQDILEIRTENRPIINEPIEGASMSITGRANEGQCGQPVSRVQSKINGGQNADQASWPWHAGVYRYDSSSGEYNFWCSAALIRPNIVIGAAETCLAGTDIAFITYISLGSQYVNSQSRLFAVQDIVCHEGYSVDADGFDICLAKLASSVAYTYNVKPVCLPSASQYPEENESCVMTGWGPSSHDGPLSPTLKEAPVRILSAGDCRNAGTRTTWDQFCAGGTGAYPCIFDEGNPVVCQENNAYVLKGITSGHSTNCSGTNPTPGRFTNVSDYDGWISNHVSRLEDESNTCYDPSTFISCGSKITRSNTILRSPVSNQDTWHYPRSTICEWYVEAPAGKDIRVISMCDSEITSSFRDYCYGDYLSFTLDDGQSTDVCGANYWFSVNTTANKMTIKFRSNSDDLVARGFVVKISFGGGMIALSSATLITFLCLLANYFMHL